MVQTLLVFAKGRGCNSQWVGCYSIFTIDAKYNKTNEGTLWTLKK
jgi:hypothetical protein